MSFAVDAWPAPILHAEVQRRQLFNKPPPFAVAPIVPFQSRIFSVARRPDGTSTSATTERCWHPWLPKPPGCWTSTAMRLGTHFLQPLAAGAVDL